MSPTRVCIWTLLGVCWASSAFAQSAVTPVHTNKSRFAIPFRSDPAEIQRLGSREVRLFVSVDAGQRWHRVQSAAPATGRFTVRAPKDGRYWFAVRTIDSEGRQHPETELSPELEVVVDTQPPALSLQLKEPAPGQVELVWDATDSHVDPTTLQLESRQKGGKTWKRVFVAQTAAGRTSWDVPAGGIVEVRGRIADKGGNVAVAQDSVRVSPTDTSVPRQKAPGFGGPLVLPNNGSTSMPDRFPRTDSPRTRTKSPDGAAKPDPGFRPARKQPAAAPPDSGRLDQRNVKSVSQTPGNNAGDAKPPEEPGTLPRFPQAPSQAPEQQTERAAPQRVVNSRQFRLNYAVDKVGRSGVDSVELFITPDGGRKWYRYGTDSDRKSPFPVTVPQDGTYGFAIRVRSGVGIADPPPKHGDAPEITIAVDQTPPKLEMLPILQGRGADSNKFLIRWKMSESRPHKQPISISYAETASGPWKTASDWTADGGRYLWTTPGDVPPRLYIRVTARDQCGNTSFVQTPRPIIVDTVKPTAKITTVDAESVER